jgi:hypothetical protein
MGLSGSSTLNFESSYFGNSLSILSGVNSINPGTVGIASLEESCFTGALIADVVAVDFVDVVDAEDWDD